MKHLRVFLISVILFSTSQSVFAQEAKNKSLAEYNGENFSEQEFAERYAMMPVFSEGKSEEELKSELLYSMIAEKLWANKAVKLGYDSTEVMKYTFKSLEKFYVRDALYNTEIKSKIKISEKDKQAAFERNRFTADINFIYSADRNEIDKIYNELISGANFDSTLNNRDEKQFQAEPQLISFGDLEPELEDVVYNLEPGKISMPVRSAKAWYIIKLNSIKEKPVPDDRSRKEEIKKVKEVLDKRAAEKIYAEYFSNFFKNIKINTNGFLFWSVSEQIIRTLAEKKEALGASTEKPDLRLQAEDLLEISDRLGADTLKMVFVEFENDPVTLEEFLYDFFFEGFYTNTVNPDIIRAQLNSRVKRFIELELLVREGFKRGLQFLPEVKNSVSIWRDYYLAEQLRKEFIADSKITDNDVSEFLSGLDSNKISPVMVNIIEILTNNLDVIGEVLSDLDRSADFKKLARKYSEREMTKKTDGEFGFFPSTEYGEIGRIAAGMNIGDIYGPLKTDDGYSIFKLIGKKEDSTAVRILKNMDKSELKDRLRSRKLMKLMVDETVEMANEQGLKVHQELLNEINVKNLNMLVYKYMGFGGRMLAYPLTPQFTDWVNFWLQSKKDIP